MKLPNIFDKSSVVAQFRAGETVFSTGQPADLMYMVRSGEVEICKNGRVIEMVGPEGFFGEMALVDDQPRSADAIAKTDSVLTTISEKQFLFMVGETPFFALSVIRELVKRLRRKE